MTVIDLLDRGLFALGALLRGPVVLLLWVCVLWAFGLLGAWVADALARRRQRNGFEVAAWAGRREPQGLPPTLRRLFEEAGGFARAENFRARMEECLTRHETIVRASAESARVLVKVGPSIGLLGTLIPMGGSLAALSQGNLEGMAAQMVAAFTSTIIGLATGTVAFFVSAQRQRWVSEDVRELRFVSDLLVEGRP